MRYLDKTFFKFTLGFLVIVSISMMVMAIAASLGRDGDVQTAQSYSSE